MKKIVALCIFIVVGLFAVGCRDPKVVSAQEQDQERQHLQYNVNNIVGNIHYIKDPRTGLCFAYYWGGAANGGPALTTVPCEAIPPELLITAKIAK